MSETNFSLVNLEGLSKAATKLIEAVSSAVGILYEPRRIRRKANADADAAVILAKSQVECKDIEVRASERLRNRELRRQNNIENITREALKALPETVSDEPVDEDWVHRFFDNCQDIGNEEMQHLWGKLLAGEVSKPGTYSLRTLNLIKHLSVEDAHLFTKFCVFNWSVANQKYCPIVLRFDDKTLLKVGLYFEDLMHLDSLGLIDFDSVSPFDLAFNESAKLRGHIAAYYGKHYVVKLVEGKNRLNIGHVLLTSVGKELAPIAGAEGSDEYRDSIIKMWKGKGFVVEERESG